MGFEGNVYACKNTTNASQVHTEDEKTNCSHLTCGRELVLCLQHFYQVESVGNTSVSKAFLNNFFFCFMRPSGEAARCLQHYIIAPRVA